jgi:hypothetical protein
MSTDTAATATDPVELQAAMLRQLTERAAHDPLAGLLLAHLQAGEESGPDPVDVLERRLEAVVRANEKLREALVAANEMTTWIARLVGACPRCWGLLPDCTTCAGRGGPGHERPATVDLVDWLAPALRRAGIVLVRRTDAGPAAAPDVRPLSSPDTTTTTKQEMS